MPDRGSLRRWLSGHDHHQSHDGTNSNDEKSTADHVSGIDSQLDDGPTAPSLPASTAKHINPFSNLKELRNQSTSHKTRMERLKEFHIIFLIDDSAAMQRDWAEALSFLSEVVPECLRHTDDGISIFFTHRWTAEPSRYEEEWKPEWPVPSGHLDIKYVTKAAAVAHGFPPEASAEFVLDNVAPVTDNNNDDDDDGRGISTASAAKPPHTMASRLAHILRPYVGAYRAGTSGDERFKHIANVDVIVVTNGADGDDVQTETLAVADGLNACGAPTSQVGVQFVQIGRDPACGAMLRALDSDIVLSERDIVDTVAYDQTRDPRTGRMTDDGLYKVLLGGVSRKVDMKRLENGHFIGKQ